MIPFQANMSDRAAASLVHRLLLVEDNPGDTLLVKEALSSLASYDLEFAEATCLRQAFSALDLQRFDGIILDLTLPDSTGIDTLVQMRDIASETPIVVLTGLDGSNGLQRRAEQLGAFEYVSKDELRQLLPRSVHWILRHKQVEVHHRELERLIEAIPDAVLVTELDGSIRFANEGAVELYRKPWPKLVGSAIGVSVREDAPAEIVIDRDGDVRTCEFRAIACKWNAKPASLVLIRDVTAQRRLQVQLVQAQRMEAVGLMAGGVAHDFNNLLLVMMIHAEMLRDECDPEHPHLPSLIEIVQSVERARNLIRQLLAFSRRHQIQTSVVQLSDIVTGMHSLLRRIIPANIEIVTLVGDDIWPVRVDRGQMEQVVMNLAVNARDAMPAGGRISIEIANRVVEGREFKLPDGDYVALEVRDNGAGIEPEVLGKIFDPFFTTKERGRGTGLGLSMCYGIVAQAGGNLSVKSSLGQGASFLVLIPRSAEEVVNAPELVADAGPSGQETILVVEDDTAVMRAAVATLKNGGYTVLMAANGDEAKRLVKTWEGKLDLVLSDVIMPQLGGPELARDLLAARPELPVVFMTGYSDHPIMSEGGDNRIENRRAILKPFRPRELRVFVRDVLDGNL
jgi:two-component system cell cycle sensor histidine kinase/response regulator CckA